MRSKLIGRNSEIEAARTREEDRQDYERELAGLDIGREARFHSTEFVEERRQGRSGASSSAARRDQREFTSRLQMMLATNSAYAKLHATALDTWRDTEDSAEKALREIEAALEETRAEQENLLERAPLIGGKRVFRDEDGSVWTEDDQRVPDEVAAGIQWNGDEPTRKEFKTGQARIDELIRSGDRIRGIQVDVADLGAELKDEENPPSAERTEGIIDDLQKYKREIEENVPKPASREIEVRGALPNLAPAVPSDIPTL